MEFSTRDTPALTPEYIEGRLQAAFRRDRMADVVAPAWLDGLNVSTDVAESDRITESQLKFWNEIAGDVIPEFFRECVRLWPTVFASLCRAYDARITRREPVNAEALADEAMGWIVTPESDGSVEEDRLMILSWLRSGVSGREWCRANEKWPTELARARKSYFTALSRRLTDLRPALRIIAVNSDIAVGVDAISKVIRRAPKNTLKMIEGGKLPAGKIAGHYCASRAMLRSLNPAAVRIQKDGRLAA